MSQTELGLPVSVVQADSSWANSSTERWAPLVLCVAVAVAAILSIRPLPVGVFQDDGIYVALAKSLASGSGYRYVNLPGEPFATHYPPLYPAFLALLWKLSPTFPANVAVFKFANALLLAASAGVFYVLTRRITKLSPIWSAVSVGAFTISAPTLLLSSMVLSEPLFLVLLAVALLVSQRAISLGTIQSAFVASLAIVALTMCKSLGVVMVPALALLLWWRKQRAAALVVVMTCLVGLLPWQLWIGAHRQEIPSVLLGKYGPYVDWFTVAVSNEGLRFPIEVLNLNAQLLWNYLQSAAGFAADASSGLKVLGSLMLSITIVVGLVRLVTAAPLILLFAVGYFTVVLLWPFSPRRFLFAVWPVVGLIITLGIQRLLTLVRSADKGVSRPFVWRKQASLLWAAANILGLFAFNVREYLSERTSGVERSAAIRALPTVEWVLNNSQLDDVIATDDDALVYLYTGRKTVPATSFRAQDHLRAQTSNEIVATTQDLLRVYQPQYVATSTMMSISGARRLAQSDFPQLEHIATLSVGAVFERRSGTRERR